MCMPKYMLTHICVGQRQQLTHMHACMHTYIHTHRLQDANSQSPGINMQTTHACIHTHRRQDANSQSPGIDMQTWFEIMEPYCGAFARNEYCIHDARG